MCASRALFGDVNLSRLHALYRLYCNSQGRAVYVRNRRGNNHQAVVCSMALWVKEHQIIIKHMREVIKRNERSEETGRAILCGQHNMLCSAESRAICVLGCSEFKCLSIYGICSTFLKHIHSTDMEVALWVVKTIQRSVLKLFWRASSKCLFRFFFPLNLILHATLEKEKNLIYSLPSLI